MQRIRLTRAGAVAALVIVLLLALVATAVAAQSLGAQPQAAGTPAANTPVAAGATQLTPATPPLTATQAPVAAPRAAPGAAFITINPSAGFPLDPFLVSLQGGGPVAASTVAPGCTGYVARAPSVTADYGGKADLLRVFFFSDGDPVLIVQTPDGKYLCNDDTTQQLLDPTIEIQKPVTGRYNVWVGSSAVKDLIPGFLVFTTNPNKDLGTVAVGSLVKRPVLPIVAPLHERLAEAAKRLQDAGAAVKSANPLTPASAPLTATVTAKGILPALELTRGITGTRAISNCDGLVSLLPDYVFNLSGDAKSVSIDFEGDGDSTLVIRPPHGGAVCSDDADGANNVNPLAVISSPANGTYLVWVGRIDASKPVTGKLTVAPGSNLKPKALPRAR